MADRVTERVTVQLSPRMLEWMRAEKFSDLKSLSAMVREGIRIRTKIRWSSAAIRDALVEHARAGGDCGSAQDMADAVRDALLRIGEGKE